MSTIAQSARLGRTASRRRARTAPRLLGGGVLWIVVFTVLLAGVVAINVAVLRLNLQLDGVNREQTQLKADISQIRGEISVQAATAQIAKTAQEQGLVQADPDATTFVRLPAK